MNTNEESSLPQSTRICSVFDASSPPGQYSPKGTETVVRSVSNEGTSSYVSSEESTDQVRRHDLILDSLPSTSTDFGKIWPDGNDKDRANSSRSEFGGSASCKRKPALPKKHIVTMEEPLLISAETGEVIDCDEESLNCTDNTLYLTSNNTKEYINGDSGLKNCPTSDSQASISGVPFSSPDWERFLTLMNSIQMAAATTMPRKGKRQNNVCSKLSSVLEQQPDSLADSNGATNSLLSEFLLSPQNALIASLMLGSSADPTNTFITPEMLPAAASLLPYLVVPYALQADGKQMQEDALFAKDSETYCVNLTFLSGALGLDSAVPETVMETTIGSLRTLSERLQEAIKSEETKPQVAMPTSSATAEVAPGAEIIIKTEEPKKHGRLRSRAQINGSSEVTLGEHVANMLNVVQLQLSRGKAALSRTVDRMSLKRRLVTTDEDMGPMFTVESKKILTKDENVDLAELENFAQNFKKQRIKFGFTQGDVGLALGRRYGTDFSQTTISRFEALNLSFKNMCKLRPLLKEWLADAESALANGASVSDLLDAAPKETTAQALPAAANVASVLNANSDSTRSKGDSTAGVIVGTSTTPLKKRRKRTNLDLSQRSALDTYFSLNPRPDHARMAQIAEALELDRDVVRVWFCNRRQKLRKE